MDAPKKFSIRSFLDRMKALQKEHGISGTAICSTTVTKRYMIVFDFPRDCYHTLVDLASCYHITAEIDLTLAE